MGSDANERHESLLCSDLTELTVADLAEFPIKAFGDEPRVSVAGRHESLSWSDLKVLTWQDLSGTPWKALGDAPRASVAGRMRELIDIFIAGSGGENAAGSRKARPLANNPEACARFAEWCGTFTPPGRTGPVYAHLAKVLAIPNPTAKTRCEKPETVRAHELLALARNAGFPVLYDILHGLGAYESDSEELEKEGIIEDINGMLADLPKEDAEMFRRFIQAHRDGRQS